MRSSRRTLLVALAVLLSVLGLTLPAAAAPADHKATPLPLTTYSSMVVDGVQGHVFVSSRTDHAVVVTDLTGNVLTTLTNLSGAAGMALAADGDSLYVALSREGAVAEIDTLTLTELARHSVGNVCPTELAVAGDRLFFSYGCDTWNAGVGSALIRPYFGDVRRSLVTNEYSPPLLDTTPGRPNLLALGTPGLSPATVRTYRIEGTALVQQASTQAGSNLRDIELSTDGSLLYAASGAPYELQSFTTDSLALRAGYAVGAYPNAVAVSHDANVIAAGVDAYYDPDVFIYRNGQFSPSRTYDFAALEIESTLLAPAGLAWGPGGKWLYAVTVDFGESPTLNILRG
jgi:hypothetical protein